MINVPRIVALTSNDRGWWRTVSGDLHRLREFLADGLAPGGLDIGRPLRFDPSAQIAAMPSAHRRRAQVDALEAPCPHRLRTRRLETYSKLLDDGARATR